MAVQGSSQEHLLVDPLLEKTQYLDGDGSDTNHDAPIPHYYRANLLDLATRNDLAHY